MSRFGSRGPSVALSLILSLALAVGLSVAAPAASTDVALQLKKAVFDPAKGLPPIPTSLRIDSEPTGGIFVVQFHDKLKPAMLDRLRGSGVRPIEYLPDQAYVVRIPSGMADTVRDMSDVRWVGVVQPDWKLSPDLGVRPYQDPARRQGGRLYATIDLFGGEDLAATRAEVEATGAEVQRSIRFGDTRRLEVRATPDQLEQAAWIESVAWIEELAEMTPRNNTARWVVQTNVSGSTTVWDHGLHGEGQIIGHIDSRIDMNSCYFKDPVDNTPGPGHRKVVAYRSNAGLGAVSHGTHTAGTSAGDQFPINGTISNNGTAYAARISHTNSTDVTGFGNTTSNLYQTLLAAHQDGARVHTNSWGDDGTTAYTTWSRDIDLFSYDHEDSLVLFAVTNTGSLRTPENAKNVLAVGASQNGFSANSFCSGGAGPTSDGRRKPEIFAPGCSIVSARNSNTCGTRTLTGTSMACPAVTGAGALVRQYFESGYYPTGTLVPEQALNPSAALVKAVLLNSAVDMTNIAGFPSNQEGWGRVLLENALFFDGETRRLGVLADVRNAEGLDTDQSASYAMTVLDSLEDLKLTLVFTEPAAAHMASSATVNDLDLEVTSPTGTVYRGNVFDTASGVSVTGGGFDPINNVEMVLLPSPEAGEWTVSVHGAEVNQERQGFALVATGQINPLAGGSVGYHGHAIQDDPPLGNGDGVIDPGETITLPLTLRNLMATTVSTVKGDLATATPGIVVTTDSADYPNISPSTLATSLPPHYRFTVAPDVACGQEIPFDVAAFHSEGADDSAFSVRVGEQVISVGAGGLPQSVPLSGTTMSTIQVTDPVTIADLNVALDISHGNVSELLVILRSPAGSSVVLHNATGFGVADLNTIYDSLTEPDGPGSMDDFDGQQAQGTWQLIVKDSAASSTPAGSLNGWTLNLEPTGGATCSALSCGDPLPAEVGGAMTVDVQADSDLVFAWPAATGASGYRIWQAIDPQRTSEDLVEATTGTSFVQPGGRFEGPSLYYVVRAVNACQWEGP